MVKHVAGLTLALILLAGSGSASAATTFHVTTGADSNSGTCPSASNCTLRAAIADAVDGDTIVVPADHIHLIGPLSINASITITGAGAGSTILDGQGANRVITVIGPPPTFNTSDASLTLRDLTVTGGSVTRTSALTQAGGAGIQNNSNGTLHLVGVTVTNNSFTASSVSSFAQNIGGGGIFSLSTVDLADSSVTHNNLTIDGAQGSSGGGGVFVAGGDLIAADTSISSNAASITETTNTNGQDGGGGAFLARTGDEVILEGATLAGNTVHILGTNFAPGDGGGGLYQAGSVSILSTGSTFSGNLADVAADNTAAGGGAVFDAGGGSAYTNTTFANNTVHATAPATGQGAGAIYYGLPDISSLANDTFTGNSPGVGSGANIYDAGTRVVVKGTILSRGASAAANCAQDATSPGTIVSDGYNLYDDLANSCTLTGTGDSHAASLGLGTLAANGGAAQTVRLLAGSPAINAGNPLGCTDAFGHALTIDERGVARPQPAGGRCDIGAYERAPATAATGLAGGVGRGVATLQGTAGNPDAVAGSWYFQYGHTTGYGKTTPLEPLAALTTAPARSALSHLASGTWHYRLVVVNPDGSTAGLDSTFVVPAASHPPAPAVLTGPARSIGAASARLTGELDGFGAPVKYRFQIGLSRRYGVKTPLRSAGARNKVVSVSALVKGLKAHRTYHYRLVVISASGRTVGPDQTFTTKRKR